MQRSSVAGTDSAGCRAQQNKQPQQGRKPGQVDTLPSDGDHTSLSVGFSQTSFPGRDIYRCVLSQDLCPFHNQYSHSLPVPGSFSPCGATAELPKGLILTWIRENISDGKKMQLLLHTKKKPSTEMPPELARNPSATAGLHGDYP